MNHLDEGTILAVRDGAREADDATGHLSSCTHCTHELGRARARAALVAGALAALDEDVEIDAAKAAVRRRLDRGRRARPTAGWQWAAVGKAAGLVLLAAGAASALPGSPFREWWWGAEAVVEPSSAPAAGATSATAPGAQAGAIEVPVTGGRISVIVRGTTPGTEVEVVWGEAPSARVTAPAGSDFTYGGGRAEVDVSGGPLRVELPRSAELATLEVDGIEYVRREAALVRVTGPAVERTDARILFVTPER